MKAKKIFVTVEFDNVPGAFDYPQNVPLPEIGHTIVTQTPETCRCLHGKVYDVRHVLTDTLMDIKIKARDE